jgi:hypothetical protein
MNQTIDPLLQPNGLTRADLRTPTFAGGADETTRRLMSIPGFRGEIACVHAAKRDAQLAANLARAQQRRLPRAASGIAATLARLATIESEVRCSTRASRPALPISKSRRSAAIARARRNGGLPGITSDGADFWPT